MTALGKVLVFINLVFSLVVAALIILLFIARTNWYAAYTKTDEARQAAVASASAANEELKRTVAESDEKVRKMQEALDKRTKELDDANAKVKKLEADLDAEARKARKSDAALAGGQLETQARAAEVAKLEAALADANKRADDLVKEMVKLREERTAAVLENRSLKDRLERLVTALEDAEKRVAKLQAGAGAATGGANVRNPPPDNVEGVVKSVDRDGRYLTISLGSDSGVARGQTLEVFRLTGGGNYLGTVRILDTRPNEAVVTPMGRPLPPIQVGDRVASRILTGGR